MNNNTQPLKRWETQGKSHLKIRNLINRNGRWSWFDDHDASADEERRHNDVLLLSNNFTANYYSNGH